ncbi:MAG: BMP family ABC transporter substrate-binding protein, partial [Clostridia bacterium]|nr:BMP family ABC transporter substrate-binding protein [Clostridia bacterium]
MKKFTTLALAALMAVSATATLVACNNEDKPDDAVRVGLITLHDNNSTYDKNFIDAMEQACKNKNATLILKTGIPESSVCYDTACDLVDQKCDVIFADSFGHEPFMLDAAEKNPKVQFCHATGTKAKVENVANYHNAFASIYEGRYLAGVAAGMKLVEMYKGGKITDKNLDENGNIKIGYVGAYTYAEVISGYTSFYLGAKSVCPTVTMDVQFTGSWYDVTAEKNAAEALIAKNCVLISQHADSMGAPGACEA